MRSKVLYMTFFALLLSGVTVFSQPNDPSKLMIDHKLMMGLSAPNVQKDSHIFFSHLRGRPQFEVTKKVLSDTTTRFTLTSMFRDKDSFCIDQVLFMTVTTVDGFVQKSESSYSTKKPRVCE